MLLEIVFFELPDFSGIMITLNCLYCRKEFFVKPYRINKAICCSKACLWHITKKDREPKRLLKIIGKKAANNAETKHFCQYCSKEFFDSPSRKRKYCSKACVNKPIKAIWKAKFTTVRKNMIARGMLKCCQKCGYNEVPKILGIHHVDGNRENNELNNLMILCPICHSLEHQKHITHGGSF